MPHHAPELVRVHHLAAFRRIAYLSRTSEPRLEVIISKSTSDVVFPFILFLVSASVPVSAQDPPTDEPPPADRWHLAAELSFTDQSGGRDLRLFTGGFNLSHREKEAFELEASVESRYGRSEGEVVARNDFGSLSFDLHPRDLWSPFLFVTAERDPFKRLDLRFSGGSGAKYTAFGADDTANEVSLSIALLYSYEDLRPSEVDPTPDDRSLARWSFRVRGEREVNDAVGLRHVTFYQPMWDHMADYLLRSETGAKVLLTERFALSVSYALNRTGRPPEGVAPEDRLFKTGFIIDF